MLKNSKVVFVSVTLKKLVRPETFGPYYVLVVGSKSFRPDIQKPRQMENAVRDIQCHLW